MKRIFASINRVMPENNLKQADLPETSEVIRNPLGTAPGFRMAVPQADGHICHLVVMPGVPREMKPMMEDSVIPWLRKNRGSDTIYAVRVFQTFGISESGLDEAVAGLIKPEEARVAFRAAFPQISLRVTVEGKPGAAERKLEELCERVRGRDRELHLRRGRRLDGGGGRATAAPSATSSWRSPSPAPAASSAIA